MQMYKTQKLKLSEKMLKGLRGLHKGLVEHGIFYRSKIRNQTFQQTIQRELNDMDRFQKEIPRIENPEIRDTTKVLTEYACAFYKLVDKRGIENYKETIEFLYNLFLNFDEDKIKGNLELEELAKSLKKYIYYFNKLVEKRGLEKSRETIDFVNKFYFEMDDKYYSELEGKPDDMKQLAEYLNSVKI